jgi:hypothetical protein
MKIDEVFAFGELNMKNRRQLYATVLGITTEDQKAIAELRAIDHAYKQANTPRPISWHDFTVRFKNALDYYFNKMKLETESV